MTITFSPPLVEAGRAVHHAAAADGNHDATTAAIDALCAAMSGRTDVERILLRAAAGAGKSHALKRMVGEALRRPGCRRVGICAFANKQVFPLAEDLGRTLGRDRVCLRVSKKRIDDVAESVQRAATVATDDRSVPPGATVVLATSHMLEMVGSRLSRQLGPVGPDGEHLFDVLFIDEAWQLPLHRYRPVERFAPITVGVGDVGQLPPLDPGQNPWRGDRGYNPYRAWPTAYDGDARTWSVSLPSVWRPTAAQLGLWRAFYADWDGLTCVAAPGDRVLEVGPSMVGAAADVWRRVATGVPTLVEVDGLPDPDAPDIDPPLLGVIEDWLDELLHAGFALRKQRYDEGRPVGEVEADGTQIAVLATRNQAVNDAEDLVERLTKRHELDDGVLVASTVDSWQGQTNGITVALHPLSGASALDEFNSAFGRLAVTCTRATHGLLLVSRAGLDDLLATAPPRPGTPFGEPGTRQLPRQTHQRILATFSRATVHAEDARG
ncbi:MAG: hypothetical protein S0880_08690 [Actinomycetota bacterium]|nr:hypothetical protein [Actinomycetota bacterium]